MTGSKLLFLHKSWRVPHVRQEMLTSLFPEHLISLPLGSSKISPIHYIYITYFAWISQTALSQTYFIIAEMQDGLWRAPANPIPKGTILFFVVHICHYDEICISEYIGTPVTDIITSSPSWNKCNCFGYLRGRGVGGFNDHTGPILFPNYPSTHIYVHVKYRSNQLGVMRGPCVNSKVILPNA